MSVLTKALAMDWMREGKKDMAITSIWPAAVRLRNLRAQKGLTWVVYRVGCDSAGDEDQGGT